MKDLVHQNATGCSTQKYNMYPLILSKMIIFTTYNFGRIFTETFSFQYTFSFETTSTYLKQRMDDFPHSAVFQMVITKLSEGLLRETKTKIL